MSAIILALLIVLSLYGIHTEHKRRAGMTQAERDVEDHEMSIW